jgi:hypothetical protein
VPQDGAAELARGSHLRGVGLRADCLSVGPARTVADGIAELADPRARQEPASHRYELTGMAGTAQLYYRLFVVGEPLSRAAAAATALSPRRHQVEPLTASCKTKQGDGLHRPAIGMPQREVSLMKASMPSMMRCRPNLKERAGSWAAPYSVPAAVPTRIAVG